MGTQPKKELSSRHTKSQYLRKELLLLPWRDIFIPVLTAATEKTTQQKVSAH
jgi:hypothetical protein